MIKMYYVAVNEIDKKIYLGKCSENGLFEQNLRCALKIKGDDLAKWEIFTMDYKTKENEIIHGKKQDVYYNFLEEFKKKKYEEPFEIINKQPKAVIDFINSLRYVLKPEQKILLSVFKKLM